MNQLLEKILEQEDFEELFQPATAKELKARQARAVEEALKDGECTQNPDGTWSCEGNVDLFNLGLKRLPVKFKRVKGSFLCEHNQLTTLEGAPEYVGRYFFCEHNQLTSLEGAPKKVEESFHCDHNRLTTLKGAPEYVGKNFYCRDNRLTSLEGAPKYVGGRFVCNHNQLTSLEGAPEYVGGVLDVAVNSLSEEEIRKAVDKGYKITGIGSENKG
ncbi:MAG: hypothetical protein ACTSUO_08535 [Candidatus Thorarchaeota archaeon]